VKRKPASNRNGNWARYWRDHQRGVPKARIARKYGVTVAAVCTAIKATAEKLRKSQEAELGLQIVEVPKC